ncbi:hypothetical protein RF11_13557 [Thelohanellus kitauei]|uniref:Uncharacterized protein n=1 Tax=Thelohanellus kitauei TaxID=669202 RepID=A0A0C2IU54_THEKT|nr:hypothetical protein RF11_13557 [Thelohanellus kitauei]
MFHQKSTGSIGSTSNVKDNEWTNNISMIKKGASNNSHIQSKIFDTVQLAGYDEVTLVYKTAYASQLYEFIEEVHLLMIYFLNETCFYVSMRHNRDRSIEGQMPFLIIDCIRSRYF